MQKFKCPKCKTEVNYKPTWEPGAPLAVELHECPICEKEVEVTYIRYPWYNDN